MKFGGPDEVLEKLSAIEAWLQDVRVIEWFTEAQRYVDQADEKAVQEAITNLTPS
jgi:hypothetical protein